MSGYSEVTDIHMQVITDGVMTGTSVITGLAFELKGRSHVSYQIVWTSTATGTMNFQVTNHPMPWLTATGGTPTALNTGVANTAATWTTLTNPSAFTALQPAGTAGNSEFGFADLGALWIRPKYTNATNTGVLQCWGSARR
jgi:hypothetical protein